MVTSRLVLLTVALLGLIAPTARAELASRVASGNAIDVETSGARPNVPRARLPNNANPATVTERQANGFSNNARTRAVREVIVEAHMRALQAHVDDYSTLDNQDNPVIATDGPVFVARAFAMIHVAMYDAFVGISRETPTYLTYSDAPRLPPRLRPFAQYVAIQRAAELVTNAVFPPRGPQPQRASPNQRRAVLRAVRLGYAFGETVAEAVLADRANDGAFDFPIFTEVPPPQRFRDHRPDPTVGPAPQQNYAAHWGFVDGFGFRRIRNPRRGGPARLPPPLRAGYQGDIEEVLLIGDRDGEANGDRSADQTEAGIFWAYDGSFEIGVPPRLYNDAVDGLIDEPSVRGRVRSPFALVRLYAVINVALADAGVVSWREKYRFNFWRPTVGIRRERRRFSGGLTPVPDWLPLGVPKTNTAQFDVFKNPSFPAYPSGHATFGAAALTAAQVDLGLSRNQRFSFVSAEFDGRARPASPGNDAAPRPRTSRSFTIAGAIEENNKSRVYLGVHWAVDSEQGEVLGTEVGRIIAQTFPARA